MSDAYLVRCSADTYGRLVGRYAARVTATGMIAAFREERAARYDSRAAAAGVATRLGRKFSGTTWEVCHG